MKNAYMMTEAQVEALATERITGAAAVDQLDGTYLRGLVAGAQSKLGAKRGRSPAATVQLEALEGIAVSFYAAVLRGVVTADIALGSTLDAAEVSRRTLERNRRATFARTAKSTLVAWIKAGGDIRGLDAATVSKSELRASVVAAKGEAPPTSRIERAQRAILAAVAREGPGEARAHLQAVVAALQAALTELPSGNGVKPTLLQGRAGSSFRGHVAPAQAAA